MPSEKVLLAYTLHCHELAGVPPKHRAAALGGQIAAYLAGAMVTLGATLEDIQAVGRSLADAGTIREGAHIVFIDETGEPVDVADPLSGFGPAGTAVMLAEDIGPCIRLAFVSAAAGLTTQAAEFPVPVADLLPIYTEVFNVMDYGADGEPKSAQRLKLTFHVGGKSVLCSNLGTGKEWLFRISKT